MPKNGDKLWEIMIKIAGALTLALFTIAVDTLRGMAGDLNELKSSMSAVLTQIDYHNKRLDKIDIQVHDNEERIFHLEGEKHGMRK